MRQWNPRMVWWGAGLLASALLAWSVHVVQGAEPTVSVDEKTFLLKPDITFVKVSFLTGQLQDLKVTERVERTTGKRLGAPMLRGLLKLKNDSTDRTAYLLGGKVEFIDPAGRPIPVEKTRGNTTFTFIGVPTDRLDPGMELSQVIEVPFPTSALATNGVRQVDVELTYLPGQYREESVSIPIHLRS